MTADHVYRGYLEDRLRDPHFVCQFGNLTVLPEERLIGQHRELDIATFDLPEFIGRYERYLSMRPTKWPPARLTKGQPVIYGVFPGASRVPGKGQTDFWFESVTGFVHDVSSEAIKLFVNYQGMYWPTQPEGEEVNTDPSGVSGGPVYLVYEMEGTQLWYLELSGFIYEFGFDTMLVRHADVIRADGTLIC